MKMDKDLLRELAERGWLDRGGDAWGACDETGVGCSGWLGTWDF